MHLTERNSWKEVCRSKWIQPEDLEEAVSSIKASGQTIATLNGSFDLLHAGHLEMIYKASQQADILLMALNTDKSIQSYKSINRPIIPLEYRLEMISALSFVDYVTWFDEPTPLNILDLIKPNVHVNGAEYGKNCIEREVVEKNGGEVYIVDLVPGLSTSAIIEKISGLCDLSTQPTMKN